MDRDNTIEVRNVSKSFKVYLDKGHTIKDHVVSSRRRRYEKREVLKDISFCVRQGEAVGLIGRNGCGKSTTLKLLTRIMYPDSGTIEMKGRVSSLIELGAGFHPDMSGKENIYINASIFGLNKKEIDDRLDDIIAFSELEAFIDNPVRTYSSGMYMRLAFAVAINVDADILLIDEILAVGDVNFQAKCFNKLREIKNSGTTIVIVSHSMGQIEQICDRSIWINDGRIALEGIPKDVHLEYMDYMNGNKRDLAAREYKRESEKKRDEENRYGDGRVRFRKLELEDETGNCRTVFANGDNIVLRMSYVVNQQVEDADFGIGVFRSDGLQCYGTNTRIDRLQRFDLVKDGELCVTLGDVKLLPGEYWIDVAIEAPGGAPVDYYKKALKFQMSAVTGDIGVSRIAHSWGLDV